jgi:hypothetical protein
MDLDSAKVASFALDILLQISSKIGDGAFKKIGDQLVSVLENKLKRKLFPDRLQNNPHILKEVEQSIAQKCSEDAQFLEKLKNLVEEWNIQQSKHVSQNTEKGVNMFNNISSGGKAVGQEINYFR